MDIDEPLTAKETWLWITCLLLVLADTAIVGVILFGPPPPHEYPQWTLSDGTSVSAYLALFASWCVSAVRMVSHLGSRTDESSKSWARVGWEVVHCILALFAVTVGLDLTGHIMR